LNELFVFNVARHAIKSIIKFASVYPKPGLITPLDNSALDGTDYPCLIDGTMSLFQSFVNFASAGADTESLNPRDSFTILQSSIKIGINDSLRATKGKLSLKGHIFCLGLLAAAAGRLIKQKRILTPGALSLTAAAFANGIIERELWTLEEKRGTKIFTQGERAYIAYGLEGCRGEVEHGYNMTLKALEILRKLDATQGQLSFREKCTHALINIMSENQDTCLTINEGITGLINVQKEAKKVIDSGGILTVEGVDAIFNMDKNLRSKGTSPAGSAVIMSCALFINELVDMKLTRSGYEE